MLDCFDISMKSFALHCMWALPMTYEASQAWAWHAHYARTSEGLRAAAGRRIMACLENVREWGFAGTMLGCLVLFMKMGGGAADVSDMLPGIGLAITSSLAAIAVKYLYEKVLGGDMGGQV